jgi:hypothetical protein
MPSREATPDKTWFVAKNRSFTPACGFTAAVTRQDSSMLWKETLVQSQIDGLESMILCSLAASGDAESLESVLQENPGLDVSKGDYDSRTPLHLGMFFYHSTS